MDNVITRGPRDYVEIPWAIKDWWNVVDVGPGSYPFYRAGYFIDNDPDKLAEYYSPKQTMLTDLHDGLPDVGDKFFDYVWCSHVLEHVDDPAACVRTLSRIGKRGTIVLPSVIKESIFDFEEREHKWLILPHPQTSIPIFVAYNVPFMQRLKDIEVQRATCRLFRTGEGHNCQDGEYLRGWFAANEKNLDIVYHWEGNAEIMVIQ